MCLDRGLCEINNGKFVAYRGPMLLSALTTYHAPVFAAHLVSRSQLYPFRLSTEVLVVDLKSVYGQVVLGRH